jgi:uncharacterized membrane protein
VRPSRPLLVALLALLAASSALAQAPPSLSPSVTIQGAETEGTVTVEEERLFSFTVTNTGLASGTPLDEQNDGDVTVTVTGLPAGWTASANPGSFRLAPGASQEVQVQVQVAASAKDREAQLTIAVEMLSPLGRLDPVLGQIPGATQRSNASATLDLTVQESFTRNVLEAVGPWIYAIVLLLVAASVVAIGLVVAARRSLVRLATDRSELPLPPGGKVAFAFQAETKARDPDNVLLRVSAVPEGWAAFLPVPELTLAPGVAQELSLVVIAPRDAAQGTRQAILVKATSSKAPKGAATLELTAVVEGVEELPSAPRRRKA